METGDVGRRVRYWRERRGLTRGHFGDLVGRSASWVDKVEKGERRLDRLSVLEQIAETLHVPVRVLLDDESFARRAECVDPVEVAAIRRALQRYAWMEPEDPIVGVFTGSDLRKQVDYAWMAFQASDYASLGPLLARLLLSGQRTYQESTDERERQIISGPVAETYQIITSTLRKLGHFDLEWVAAERGLSAAESVDDPVIFGGAAFRLVNALRDNNGAPAAITVAHAAAERLSGALSSTDSAPRSLYGQIVLQGAMSAAQAELGDEVRSLLGEARAAADRVGEGC